MRHPEGGDGVDSMKLAGFMGDYERRDHFYRYVLLSTIGGPVIFSPTTRGRQRRSGPAGTLGPLRFAHFWGHFLTRLNVTM